MAEHSSDSENVVMAQFFYACEIGRENAPPGKWAGLHIQQKLKSLKDQLKISSKATFITCHK